MDRTELTTDERRLLARIVEDDAGQRLAFEIASLGPATVLGVVGMVERSTLAFSAALAILLTFRVWAVVHDRRNLPVLQSAVGKLLSAAGATADRPTA
jgi:hypothetical protein